MGDEWHFLVTYCLHYNKSHVCFNVQNLISALNLALSDQTSSLKGKRVLVFFVVHCAVPSIQLYAILPVCRILNWSNHGFLNCLKQISVPVIVYTLDTNKPKFCNKMFRESS